MKTPKEYRDNLLNHIITKQMLVDCLYSVNNEPKTIVIKKGNKERILDVIGMYIILHLLKELEKRN